MKTSDLVHVAERIGERIVGSAVWDGPICAWDVRRLDRGRGGAVAKPADGTFYQGTAGIAWFLGSLYRVTGDRRAAETAQAAIGHALHAAEAMPEPSFGFHSGRVGIAYAGVQLGRWLDREDHRAAAHALLLPLRGLEAKDHGLDVIAGAAGAIPALLELSVELADERLLEMALALGDRLMERAERETGGWSWDTTGAAAIRHLVGFAHGTAGIGLALLELYHATGRSAYRFGAEMAFLYEQSFYDSERRNWPDLRHGELSDLLYFNQPDTLRRALADVEAAVPAYMAAWCHGAPGIGLARLRAWELSGQAAYRQQAEAALTVTEASFRRRHNDNFSMCHGHAGNSETLLYAAEILARPELRDRCLECAEYGRESFEDAGRPWRCGTPDNRPDPSLMVGEAGIGTFYLRLADPTIPSPLIVRPPVPESIREDAGRGFDHQAEDSSSVFFGRTLKVLRALDLAPPVLGLDSRAPLARSPIEITHDRLRRLIAKLPLGTFELAEDAFLRDRTAYELSAGAEDFAIEHVESLRRPRADEVDFDGVAVVRSPRCEVVSERWDWERWLANDSAGLPPLGPSSIAVVRHKTRTSGRPLSPFAAALLESLTSPASLDESLQRVADLVADSGALDTDLLRQTIRQQLRELYRAGFVEIASAVGTAQAASD